MKNKKELVHCSFKTSKIKKDLLIIPQMSTADLACFAILLSSAEKNCKEKT